MASTSATPRPLNAKTEPTSPRPLRPLPALSTTQTKQTLLILPTYLPLPRRPWPVQRRANRIRLPRRSEWSRRPPPLRFHSTTRWWAHRRPYWTWNSRSSALSQRRNLKPTPRFPRTPSATDCALNCLLRKIKKTSYYSRVCNYRYSRLHQLDLNNNRRY